MVSLSDTHPRLGIMLVCADWRLHQRDVALNARLAERLNLSGIDVIAAPGPDGLLEPERAGEWAAVVGQIRLLIEVHAPVALLVTGHQHCAGHPVEDEQHEADILALARALKAATDFSGPIHAMMLVYRTDQDWDIAPVAVF